jgi:hypothetical protein
MVSLMNIMWLQAAPTAFATIGWKFYLCFIIPGTIGGLCMWFLFPDTNGLPLEEVAAIFGGQDEVALYMAEIVVENGAHGFVVRDLGEIEKTEATDGTMMEHHD